MNDLLAWTVEAHGGLERWERVAGIRMQGQMGGLGLFHSAYDSDPVRIAHLKVDVPFMSIEDFPEPGMKTVGAFADTLVRIESADGSRIARQRKNARNAFLKYPARLRRWFWYDLLDVTYFLGYALWNYLLTPFLFTRPGFEVEEGEPIRRFGRALRRLIVRYPPQIPAHCPVQTFYINEKGLINYFEYTVDIIGAWVRAVHYCRAYRNFDGIMVPTKRRVVLKHDHFLRNWRIRNNIATIMWGNVYKLEFIAKEQ